uniref:Pco131370 n=1 Tax=Arundo donax TaxID=35708 RepID=A0A0A9CCA3_ARUDO
MVKYVFLYHVVFRQVKKEWNLHAKIARQNIKSKSTHQTHQSSAISTTTGASPYIEIVRNGSCIALAIPVRALQVANGSGSYSLLDTCDQPLKLQ